AAGRVSRAPMPCSTARRCCGLSFSRWARAIRPVKLILLLFTNARGALSATRRRPRAYFGVYNLLSSLRSHLTFRERGLCRRHDGAAGALGPLVEHALEQGTHRLVAD